MVTFREMHIEDSGKIWDIDRSERIEFIYKCHYGILQEIRTAHECPNWTVEMYQEIISRYKYELWNGGTAIGAFDGQRLVGFGVLGHKFRGQNKDRLQIDLMYVTRQYRRQGIGRKIMDSLSKVAKDRGAAYLYISSTESESAVKFYTSCGSVLTSEVDDELFAKEPFDIHMVKKL